MPCWGASLGIISAYMQIAIRDAMFRRGPNSLGLDWHWLERPPWHELVRAGLLLIENDLNLSDASGLGVELDETAAERYLRPGAICSPDET